MGSIYLCRKALLSNAFFTAGSSNLLGPISSLVILSLRALFRGVCFFLPSEDSPDRLASVCGSSTTIVNLDSEDWDLTLQDCKTPNTPDRVQCESYNTSFKPVYLPCECR